MKIKYTEFKIQPTVFPVLRKWKHPDKKLIVLFFTKSQGLVLESDEPNSKSGTVKDSMNAFDFEVWEVLQSEVTVTYNCIL